MDDANEMSIKYDTNSYIGLTWAPAKIKGDGFDFFYDLWT